VYIILAILPKIEKAYPKRADLAGSGVSMLVQR